MEAFIKNFSLVKYVKVFLIEEDELVKKDFSKKEVGVFKVDNKK